MAEVVPGGYGRGGQGGQLTVAVRLPTVLKRGLRVLPDGALTSTQRTHLRLARAIADRLFRIDKIKGVYAASISLRTPGGRKALGLYDRKTCEVFLAPEALDTAFVTVAMLSHELAHHASGAEDFTEEHMMAMQEVGAKLVRYTSQGMFDAELQEARWE